MIAIRSYAILSRYITIYAVSAGGGNNTLLQFANTSNNDITNSSGVLHMVLAPTAYRTIQELPEVDCSSL